MAETPPPAGSTPARYMSPGTRRIAKLAMLGAPLLGLAAGPAGLPFVLGGLGIGAFLEFSGNLDKMLNSLLGLFGMVKSGPAPGPTPPGGDSSQQDRQTGSAPTIKIDLPGPGKKTPYTGPRIETPEVKNLTFEDLWKTAKHHAGTLGEMARDKPVTTAVGTSAGLGVAAGLRALGGEFVKTLWRSTVGPREGNTRFQELRLGMRRTFVEPFRNTGKWFTGQRQVSLVRKPVNYLLDVTVNSWLDPITGKRIGFRDDVLPDLLGRGKGTYRPRGFFDSGSAEHSATRVIYELLQNTPKTSPAGRALQNPRIVEALQRGSAQYLKNMRGTFGGRAWLQFRRIVPVSMPGSPVVEGVDTAHLRRVARVLAENPDTMLPRNGETVAKMLTLEAELDLAVRRAGLTGDMADNFRALARDEFIGNHGKELPTRQRITDTAKQYGKWRSSNPTGRDRIAPLYGDPVVFELMPQGPARIRLQDLVTRSTGYLHTAHNATMPDTIHDALARIQARNPQQFEFMTPEDIARGVVEARKPATGTRPRAYNEPGFGETLQQKILEQTTTRRANFRKQMQNRFGLSGGIGKDGALTLTDGRGKPLFVEKTGGVFEMARPPRGVATLEVSHYDALLRGRAGSMAAVTEMMLENPQLFSKNANTAAARIAAEPATYFADERIPAETRTRVQKAYEALQKSNPDAAKRLTASDLRVVQERFGKIPADRVRPNTMDVLLQEQSVLRTVFDNESIPDRVRARMRNAYDLLPPEQRAKLSAQAMLDALRLDRAVQRAGGRLSMQDVLVRQAGMEAMLLDPANTRIPKLKQTYGEYRSLLDTNPELAAEVTPEVLRRTAAVRDHARTALDQPMNLEQTLRQQISLETALGKVPESVRPAMQAAFEKLLLASPEQAARVTGQQVENAARIFEASRQAHERARSEGRPSTEPSLENILSHQGRIEAALAKPGMARGMRGAYRLFLQESPVEAGRVSLQTLERASTLHQKAQKAGVTMNESTALVTQAGLEQALNDPRVPVARRTPIQRAYEGFLNDPAKVRLALEITPEVIRVTTQLHGISSMPLEALFRQQVEVQRALNGITDTAVRDGFRAALENLRTNNPAEALRIGETQLRTASRIHQARKNAHAEAARRNRAAAGPEPSFESTLRLQAEIDVALTSGRVPGDMTRAYHELASKNPEAAARLTPEKIRAASLAPDAATASATDLLQRASNPPDPRIAEALKSPRLSKLTTPERAALADSLHASLEAAKAKNPNGARALTANDLVTLAEQAHSPQGRPQGSGDVKTAGQALYEKVNPTQPPPQAPAPKPQAAPKGAQTQIDPAIRTELAKRTYDTLKPSEKANLSRAYQQVLDAITDPQTRARAAARIPKLAEAVMRGIPPNVLNAGAALAGEFGVKILARPDGSMLLQNPSNPAEFLPVEALPEKPGAPPNSPKRYRTLDGKQEFQVTGDQGAQKIEPAKPERLARKAGRGAKPATTPAPAATPHGLSGVPPKLNDVFNRMATRYGSHPANTDIPRFMLETYNALPRDMQVLFERFPQYLEQAANTYAQKAVHERTGSTLMEAVLSEAHNATLRSITNNGNVRQYLRDTLASMPLSERMNVKPQHLLEAAAEYQMIPTEQRTHRTMSDVLEQRMRAPAAETQALAEQPHRRAGPITEVETGLSRRGGGKPVRASGSMDAVPVSPTHTEITTPATQTEVAHGNYRPAVATPERVTVAQRVRNFSRAANGEKGVGTFGHVFGLGMLVHSGHHLLTHDHSKSPIANRVMDWGLFGGFAATAPAGMAGDAMAWSARAGSRTAQIGGAMSRYAHVGNKVLGPLAGAYEAAQGTGLWDGAGDLISSGGFDGRYDDKGQWHPGFMERVSMGGHPTYFGKAYSVAHGGTMAAGAFVAPVGGALLAWEVGKIGGNLIGWGIGRAMGRNAEYEDFVDACEKAYLAVKAAEESNRQVYKPRPTRLNLGAHQYGKTTPGYVPTPAEYANLGAAMRLLYNRDASKANTPVPPADLRRDLKKMISDAQEVIGTSDQMRAKLKAEYGVEDWHLVVNAFNPAIAFIAYGLTPDKNDHKLTQALDRWQRAEAALKELDGPATRTPSYPYLSSVMKVLYPDDPGAANREISADELRKKIRLALQPVDNMPQGSRRQELLEAAPRLRAALAELAPQGETTTVRYAGKTVKRITGIGPNRPDGKVMVNDIVTDNYTTRWNHYNRMYETVGKHILEAEGKTGNTSKKRIDAGVHFMEDLETYTAIRRRLNSEPPFVPAMKAVGQPSDGKSITATAGGSSSTSLSTGGQTSTSVSAPVQMVPDPSKPPVMTETGRQLTRFMHRQNIRQIREMLAHCHDDKGKLRAGKSASDLIKRNIAIARELDLPPDVKERMLITNERQLERALQQYTMMERNTHILSTLLEHAGKPASPLGPMPSNAITLSTVDPEKRLDAVLGVLTRHKDMLNSFGADSKDLDAVAALEEIRRINASKAADKPAKLKEALMRYQGTLGNPPLNIRYDLEKPDDAVKKITKELKPVVERLEKRVQTENKKFQETRPQGINPKTRLPDYINMKKELGMNPPSLADCMFCKANADSGDLQLLDDPALGKMVQLRLPDLGQLKEKEEKGQPLNDFEKRVKHLLQSPDGWLTAQGADVQIDNKYMVIDFETAKQFISEDVLKKLEAEKKTAFTHAWTIGSGLKGDALRSSLTPLLDKVHTQRGRMNESLSGDQETKQPGIKYFLPRIENTYLATLAKAQDQYLAEKKLLVSNVASVEIIKPKDGEIAKPADREYPQHFVESIKITMRDGSTHSVPVKQWIAERITVTGMHAHLDNGRILTFDHDFPVFALGAPGSEEALRTFRNKVVYQMSPWLENAETMEQQASEIAANIPAALRNASDPSKDMTGIRLLRDKTRKKDDQYVSVFELTYRDGSKREVTYTRPPKSEIGNPVDHLRFEVIKQSVSHAEAINDAWQNARATGGVYTSQGMKVTAIRSEDGKDIIEFEDNRTSVSNSTLPGGKTDNYQSMLPVKGQKKFRLVGHFSRAGHGFNADSAIQFHDGVSWRNLPHRELIDGDKRTPYQFYQRGARTVALALTDAVLEHKGVVRGGSATPDYIGKIQRWRQVIEPQTEGNYIVVHEDYSVESRGVASRDEVGMRFTKRIPANHAELKDLSGDDREKMILKLAETAMVDNVTLLDGRAQKGQKPLTYDLNAVKLPDGKENPFLFETLKQKNPSIGLTRMLPYGSDSIVASYARALTRTQVDIFAYQEELRRNPPPPATRAKFTGPLAGGQAQGQGAGQTKGRGQGAGGTGGGVGGGVGGGAGGAALGAAVLTLPYTLGGLDGLATAPKNRPTTLTLALTPQPNDKGFFAHLSVGVKGTITGNTMRVTEITAMTTRGGPQTIKMPGNGITLNLADTEQAREHAAAVILGRIGNNTHVRQSLGVAPAAHIPVVDGGTGGGKGGKGGKGGRGTGGGVALDGVEGSGYTPRNLINDTELAISDAQGGNGKEKRINLKGKQTLPDATLRNKTFEFAGQQQDNGDMLIRSVKVDGREITFSSPVRLTSIRNADGQDRMRMLQLAKAAMQTTENTLSTDPAPAPATAATLQLQQGVQADANLSNAILLDNPAATLPGSQKKGLQLRVNVPDDAIANQTFLVEGQRSTDPMKPNTVTVNAVYISEPGGANPQRVAIAPVTADLTTDEGVRALAGVIKGAVQAQDPDAQEAEQETPATVELDLGQQPPQTLVGLANMVVDANDYTKLTGLILAIPDDTLTKATPTGTLAAEGSVDKSGKVTVTAVMIPDPAKQGQMLRIPVSELPRDLSQDADIRALATTIKRAIVERGQEQQQPAGQVQPQAQAKPQGQQQQAQLELGQNPPQDLSGLIVPLPDAANPQTLAQIDIAVPDAAIQGIMPAEGSIDANNPDLIKVAAVFVPTPGGQPGQMTRVPLPEAETARDMNKDADVRALALLVKRTLAAQKPAKQAQVQQRQPQKQQAAALMLELGKDYKSTSLPKDLPIVAVDLPGGNGVRGLKIRPSLPDPALKDKDFYIDGAKDDATKTLKISRIMVPTTQGNKWVRLSSEITINLNQPDFRGYQDAALLLKRAAAIAEAGGDSLTVPPVAPITVTMNQDTRTQLGGLIEELASVLGRQQAPAQGKTVALNGVTGGTTTRSVSTPVGGAPLPAGQDGNKGTAV